MVPSSRGVTRITALRLSHRYLVDRLHFRGDGDAQAAFPRRFRNRSIVPYFQVRSSIFTVRFCYCLITQGADDSDGGDMAGRDRFSRLQGDVSELDELQLAESSREPRRQRVRPPEEHAHL